MESVVTADLIGQFDRLIRRDPAQRGLIGTEAVRGPLCPGDLRSAAIHLAGAGQVVVIVTGFYIPRGEPPAAETDGPPGAVFLAESLRRAGIETWVLTDDRCLSAVLATAKASEFPVGQVLSLPVERNNCQAACNEFWTKRPGTELTHLIALERVGPSHTLESLAAQSESAVSEFATAVPEDERDRCHNMRGEVIDENTAPLHLLFEQLREHRPGARSIGIGDGGNEIGMGRVPWTELSQRLSGPQRFCVPCRIATDWNILAGTSNWGGYALAAATLLLRGQFDLLSDFTLAQQEFVLQELVTDGPAVDGVTRRREPTVDGLPFLTYIQPWVGMRRLMDWAD